MIVSRPFGTLLSLLFLMSAPALAAAMRRANRKDLERLKRILEARA